MAQSFHTNLSNVALHFVQQLHAKVTPKTLKENLEENPYYPTLLSLSNVFDRFGIEHEAYRLSKEQLPQLGTPFIAYLGNQNTGSDFVLVTQMSDQEIQYIAEGKQPKKATVSQFMSDFQDIVFVAEASHESGELGFFEKKKLADNEQQKTLLIQLGGGLSFFLMAWVSIGHIWSAWGEWGMFAIKIPGVLATVLLLWYEIDRNNRFVKNICTLGKKTNCDAVLHSKAGRIWGISWSEIGFFYFAATLLLLLIPGVPFAFKAWCLIIVNTLAVPYVVFSLYYQWKIVKQWCPLCLVVQVVLVLEFIWSVLLIQSIDLPLSAVTNPKGLAVFVTCIIVPIIGWFSLKRVFSKAQKEGLFKTAYKRLVGHPEIFKSLLAQQSAAPAGWQELGIALGDSQAPNTIIKVCSPYCSPCAKAHPVLENIIKKHHNVQVKVIFTATNNPDDRGGTVVRHLLAVSNQGDPHQTEKALDDWYLADKKDYVAFADKYPINGELKAQDDQIDAMSQWCKIAEITHTPTFFINGRRLPEEYTLEDLENLLR